MADSPFNRLELEAWSQSLQDAVSTGELYAQRCLSRIRPGAMTKVANTPVRRSPSSTPRRAIRSAAGDGIPIEDLGIAGIPYKMTRADLMNGNKDLLGFCTDMLR